MSLAGFNSEDSRVFVNYYKLSKDEDKAQYEDLINNSEIIITREEFTYDKSGKPTITIWWKKED